MSGERELIHSLILIQFKDRCDNIIMDHEPWSMVQDHINRKVNMNKKIKAEYLPGGAKRQELLDQVPNYLRTPGLQANKHMFCIDILKMTETEYLEALNKATNGEVERSLWN